MQLRQYIYEHRVTASHIARAVGVSVNYLGNIVRGKYKPSKRLARDISEYTQGAVTIDDLMADIAVLEPEPEKPCMQKTSVCEMIDRYVREIRISTGKSKV